MSFIEQLKEEGIDYILDEPLKSHNSFRTGGNADVFITPAGVGALSKTIKLCARYDLKPLILGNGSNMLIPDEGLRRPVIHIGSGFDNIEVDGCLIHCGAGVPLKKLCRTAYENALSGLEFAYGIPGNVGGAAYMNAGAYGEEMKNVLVSCTHIDNKGEAGILCSGDLQLDYRKSAYTDNGFVITGITVGLRNASKSEIKAKMDELMCKRRDKQPLEYPSAGSVFKRPQGYFAGALIEESGLKGKRIGGAMVSTKHAGFIINYDNATTKDVTDLIDYCRETVFKNTGVMLETEIKTVEDITSV